MYQQVETDNKVQRINWGNHTYTTNPVATLADEYGGRLQITVDDHCFILLVKRSKEFNDIEPVYVPTHWWNREAIEVLKTLPTSLLD
jgi:hypothetical protein